MKKKPTHSRKSTAQAMVEFALILPVLLLLIYGMLEVGRLLFIYSSVVSAARQASRYGATTGVNAAGIFRYRDCAGMRDAAQRVGFIDNFADADIEIWHDEGEGVNQVGYCPAGTATDGTFIPSIGNVNRIRVRVHTEYAPIVPIVPFDPFVIESFSARTILVSVPIIITSAPQGWDPNSTPIPPASETPTITLTPTITNTPTSTSTATPTGSATATATDTPTPMTPTNTGTATNTSTPVPPPSAFNKTSPSDNDTGEPYPSTHLTWQASTNADYYEVCIDQTDDNSCDSNDNWPILVTGTSYDANTVLGTLYSWHVRAVNYENPTIKTYSNGSSTAFWSFTTSTSVSSCFAKGDPLSYPAPPSKLGFSTTIYNKSAFTISISQLKITWNRTPSQKLDAIKIGTTTIGSLNSNSSPHTQTISVPVGNILANGSITIEVWFQDYYTKASTDEIVVTFGTSGCAPLVIK